MVAIQIFRYLGSSVRASVRCYFQIAKIGQKCSENVKTHSFIIRIICIVVWLELVFNLLNFVYLIICFCLFA